MTITSTGYCVRGRFYSSISPEHFSLEEFFSLRQGVATLYALIIIYLIPFYKAYQLHVCMTYTCVRTVRRLVAVVQLHQTKEFKTTDKQSSVA